MSTTIKNYYRLTKPGIIYGNLLTAAAGFFVAGRGPVDWALLCWMLLGLSLVIGSACVFNNYFDRGIDAKMERTRGRAIAAGRISGRAAIIFGSILLPLGVAALYFFTTPWALAAALAGFAVYVFLYTPLKHRSSMSLYVGAVAGAMPPVVGYAAGAGAIDYVALILFALIFAWQLPHFIAIAFYRFSEYAAAGVPLVVRNEPPLAAKRRARRIFLASLIVLLIFFLGSALWRLFLS
jgi:protoheme IX farnesyltransferase